MFAALNCFALKIASGTRGCGLRCSTARNAPRNTSPPIRGMSTEGDDQPRSGPAVRPAMTPASPMIVSTAPAMSSPGGAWSFLLSGT